MHDFYTVSEYAKVTGKDPGNIRKNLITGALRGEKLGKQWIIPKDAVYPEDKRIKSGNYRNWRKASGIRQSNPELMKAVSRMCGELGKVYGTALEKIVLYGSYARGEETPESDVDIALILNEPEREDVHDAMTDIVVEYELKQGVTFSVISVDKEQYMRWRETMPFYQNIAREGIVLWKTA